MCILVPLRRCALFVTAGASVVSSRCMDTGVADEHECKRGELGLVALEMLQVQKPLQQRGKIPTQADTSPIHSIARPSVAPTDRLRTALPLAWTHVPKCGGSFLNTLIRLPGVCPYLPTSAKHVVYGERHGNLPNFYDTFPDWPNRCPGLQMLPFTPDIGIFMMFIEEICHLIFQAALGGLRIDGQDVGSTFEHLYDGHGVIMLRQPEQRAISMYNHVRGNTTYGGAMYKSIETANEFARRTAGCAVRMLTKEPVNFQEWRWNTCMGLDNFANEIKPPSVPAKTDRILRSTPPLLDVSNADVAEAQRRLRRYAFVGITDEWHLSICLLHTMFGGQCYPAEFAAVRLQRTNKTDAYDTSVLQGFVDQYDGALYEEASSIFAENLKQYEVSEASCSQCFKAAGLETASVA